MTTNQTNDLNANRSLLVIGECMMELAENGDSYKRTFAGDTYNSAVYAKRRYHDMDVQILTTIGSDPISDAMVTQWNRDQIGHALVTVSDKAHPGIYAISTDPHGERSFTYWRAGSAATELVALMTDEIRQEIARFNTIYFSGITLAILTDKNRDTLLSLIAVLKQQGRTIAFDPNYRAALWRDAKHARYWLTRAYQMADIALPGLADHNDIFDHQNVHDVRTFFQDFDIREIILKADDAGIFGYSEHQQPVHLSFTAAQNPIDTTGAGDSFAGTYLAERIAGVSMIEALRSAADVASLVVAHRGAIIDASLYRDAFGQGS